MEAITMTLREKLMHYTYDLDCGADLKQEAIAAIESIAQYMDEDEILHHSRPLAIAYLALTEDASAAGGACGHWVRHYRSGTTVGEGYVSTCCDMWNKRKSDYCPNCGARMDGDDGG